jgi:hypothetical protein
MLNSVRLLGGSTLIDIGQAGHIKAENPIVGMVNGKRGIGFSNDLRAS